MVVLVTKKHGLCSNDFSVEEVKKVSDDVTCSEYIAF